MQDFRHHNRGFSLTELAIALAVVGAIIGAVWGATALVQNGQKAQRLLQDALTAVDMLRDRYRNYNASDLDKLTTNSFPPVLQATSSSSSDIVLSYYKKTGSPQGINAKIKYISKSQCVKILTSVPTEKEIGLLAACAGKGCSMNISTPMTFPITVSIATTACALAGNDNEVNLVFKIRN